MILGYVNVFIIKFFNVSILFFFFWEFLVFGMFTRFFFFEQGYCGSFNSPISQLNFACHQEKQSPRFSSGNGCISTITLNTASTGPGISSKTRIRWTQDLHEKFVECVNRLGGAESKLFFVLIIFFLVK